jgi:dienelactone hydrolase
MNFGPFVEELGDVVKAGKARFSGVDSWGSVGLCWGGKVAVLLSGSETVFKVTAQVHPGFVFLVYFFHPLVHCY